MEKMGKPGRVSPSRKCKKEWPATNYTHKKTLYIRVLLKELAGYLLILCCQISTKDKVH
jgi:hypothetical protein